MYLFKTPAGKESSFERTRKVLCSLIAFRQSIARILSLLSSRAVREDFIACCEGMLHTRVQNLFKRLPVCTRQVVILMGTDLHSIVELPQMSLPKAKNLADRLSNCNTMVEVLHCTRYVHPLMEKEDKEGLICNTRKLIVFPLGSTYEEAQQQLAEFFARLAGELPRGYDQKTYCLREKIK